MVAAGLTLVEPVADVEVKVPGAMEMLFAPVTVQLSVLLAPAMILVGFEVKEPMVGLVAAATVTVSLDLAEPVALVAVNV